MSSLKSLLFLLALAVQMPLASAKSVTYAVGTCQPKLPSYPTITAALTATPSPNVVKVCPGTYNEQIEITSPVTVEGISYGNFSGATIAVPSGGLPINVNNNGQPMAVQVWVNNVNGDVNLTNLIIDGTGNNVTGYNFMAGVLYENSPGTMNHLTTQNQGGTSQGYGVWLQGGSANPTVTLENSNLQSFGTTGVQAYSDSSSPGLTAIIKGNYLTPSSPANPPAGIETGTEVTASISSNLLAPGFLWGIGSEAGAISRNTVSGVLFRGISVTNASVTSNVVYNSGAVYADPAAAAIWVGSSAAPVTGNIITQSGNAGNAIDFDCTAGDNVHSNTILGAANALVNVATGANPTNAIYSAGTLRGSQTLDECP